MVGGTDNAYKAYTIAYFIVYQMDREGILCYRELYTYIGRLGGGFLQIPTNCLILFPSASNAKRGPRQSPMSTCFLACLLILSCLSRPCLHVCAVPFSSGLTHCQCDSLTWVLRHSSFQYDRDFNTLSFTVLGIAVTRVFKSSVLLLNIA